MIRDVRLTRPATHTYNGIGYPQPSVIAFARSPLPWRVAGNRHLAVVPGFLVTFRWTECFVTTKDWLARELPLIGVAQCIED